ncbi:hypothetical protein RCH12_002726 [Cryobacterium sp. MP_3.1]|uniref:hypothetical protein n=1 Tax=Cryobacterium sp. MP_3.1 TaxID=3071711 RepID=UPI002DF7DFD9|nr:hypothetical protein [Cryobacterium sp. MP_3.1]
MNHEIISAERLEAVENDVAARTATGTPVTLCAKVSLVHGANRQVGMIRIGVVGSRVGCKAQVTSDDFIDGEFSLTAVYDALNLIVYGIGDLFGLDVFYAPQRGVNNLSWTLTSEAADHSDLRSRLDLEGESPENRERAFELN